MTRWYGFKYTNVTEYPARVGVTRYGLCDPFDDVPTIVIDAGHTVVFDVERGELLDGRIFRDLP